MCVTSNSGKQRDVAKEAWDKERFGMLCLTDQGFGDIKAAILKLCHENKKCVYETERIEGNIKKAKKVNQ